MRERTIRVDTRKLEILSSLYRSSQVAKRLNISKQRWHNYKTGTRDIPESTLEAICKEFQLNMADLELS